VFGNDRVAIIVNGHFPRILAISEIAQLGRPLVFHLPELRCGMAFTTYLYIDYITTDVVLLFYLMTFAQFEKTIACVVHFG